jgi:carbonic anhydrase/acetyltransferase-like protein (isoleucine patch superfamily)
MTDRHVEWPDRLRLAPDVFVAPTATVTGEVAIGARSSVWYGTVLRGDVAPIVVGEETSLQELTLLHCDHDAPCTVGSRVTVGHRAIIHGCTIGDDTLIGMGAILLSRSVVGPGCLIGAGSLVKEGQVIPPGMLAVGAPARVVGPVTDAHREAIASGARHYVSMSRGYLRRGVGSQWPARRTLVMPQPLTPMSFFEWEQRIGALQMTPEWTRRALEQHGAARFQRRPGDGRWCALEVMAHLLDCDREVYGPRIHRTLTEAMPAVEDIPAETWVAARGHAGADADAVLAQWREARTALLRGLSVLGPDAWVRPLLHPVRGPHTLADIVRYWTEHDFSHRRQMALALEAGA